MMAQNTCLMKTGSLIVIQCLTFAISATFCIKCISYFTVSIVN